MTPLKATSTQGFWQLEVVISQLSAEQYARPLPLLSGYTIGKHVRHVLECYELLIDSSQTGNLDYSRRHRSASLEKDPHEALGRIRKLEQAIRQLDLNRELTLEISTKPGGTERTQIPSTAARELLHNIEHAIHHMALIQLALQHVFPEVQRPPHFGLAPATVQHQSQQSVPPD